MRAIVVGGGASGLISAINLASKGFEVTILERNNECGKKLLTTGSGKCNYFNQDMAVNHYISSNMEELNRFINEKNCLEALALIHSIGIVPNIKNGYYYPYSNTASSVRNMLLLKLKSLNVKIVTNCLVEEIKKNGYFMIKTNLGMFSSDILVLATGSNAGIKEDNSYIYRYLKEVGHTIMPIKPALVPLESESKIVKNWAGIRTVAKVKLVSNGIVKKEFLGEAQLTKYGISGICVMNLSNYIDSYEDNTLIINFLPFIKMEDGYNYFVERSMIMPKLTIIEMLESLINYKLLYAILDYMNIDPNKTWNDLTEEKKRELVQNILAFKLPIKDTLDIYYAQSKRGGVLLKEVSDSCESKIIKNLYIVGELLDVTGECGGYNLGFAWISGLVIKNA